MRTKLDLIKETLIAHSGHWIVSREITSFIQDVYGRGISSKSVGKLMVVVEDEGYVERKEHNVTETNATGCKYEYMWIPVGENDEVCLKK